jgi:hypothetical protein
MQPENGQPLPCAGGPEVAYPTFASSWAPRATHSPYSGLGSSKSERGLEPALPMLKMLPALPMLRIEPELPMLRIEPALPMDRIDPTLPMLRTLPKLRMLPMLPKLKMLNKLLALSGPARLPVLLGARPHVDRTDVRMAAPFLSRCLLCSPRENTLAS